MKNIKIYIFIYLFLFLFNTGKAQAISSLGTAFTVGKKQVEMGIFSPLRIGIGRTFEVQSFWAANYKLPNISIKKYWITTFGDISIASRHSIYYPTPIIRKPLLATALAIPDSFGFAPPILAFRNEIIFSKMLQKKTICNAENYLLSLKLGLANAKLFSKDTFFMPYYEHLLYPRTSIFNKNVLWYIGLDIDGHWGEKLDFFADIEFMSIDWTIKAFAIEHKAGLSWYMNKHTKLWIGYKTAIGNYPTPNRVFFSPLIDIVFHFNFPKFGRDKGLFKQKMY